jgi:signal transduction histidine kinase
MTLRFRLILWFTGTLTVILLVFCGALVWLQPQVDIATLDDELANDIVTVSGVLANEVDERGPGAQAVADMLDELKLPQRGIAVFDPSGHLLGAQWNGLDAGDAIGVTPASSGAWTYHSPAGDARMRIGETKIAGGRYRVAIAASLDEVIHEGLMLRRAVVVAVRWRSCSPPSAAPSRPRARFDRSVAWPEASGITATDAKRLTIVNPRDEMGMLARAFNDLIDRLNDAIDQQRRFMADASHELRTPVSVVRTAGRDAWTRCAHRRCRESFRIVSEQARRLSGLVEDMFLLARVDAGQRQIVATDFYFDEIVTECVRSTRCWPMPGTSPSSATSPPTCRIRAMKRWRASSWPTCSVTRSAMRLRRPGLVSLTVAGSLLRLSVSDDGAGVRPEDRERIFERFVKLDPTRNADGGGPSLSIARWVATRRHADAERCDRRQDHLRGTFPLCASCWLRINPMRRCSSPRGCASRPLPSM